MMADAVSAQYTAYGERSNFSQHMFFGTSDEDTHAFFFFEE